MQIDLDSFIVWLLTQLDTDSGDAEREARIYERVFSKNEENKKDEKAEPKRQHQSQCHIQNTDR